MIKNIIILSLCFMHIGLSNPNLIIEKQQLVHEYNTINKELVGFLLDKNKNKNYTILISLLQKSLELPYSKVDLYSYLLNKEHYSILDLYTKTRNLYVCYNSFDKMVQNQCIADFAHSTKGLNKVLENAILESQTCIATENDEIQCIQENIGDIVDKQLNLAQADANNVYWAFKSNTRFHYIPENLDPKSEIKNKISELINFKESRIQLLQQFQTDLIKLLIKLEITISPDDPKSLYSVLSKAGYTTPKDIATLLHKSTNRYQISKQYLQGAIGQEYRNISETKNTPINQETELNPIAD